MMRLEIHNKKAVTEITALVSILKIAFKEVQILSGKIQYANDFPFESESRIQYFHTVDEKREGEVFLV